MAVAGAEVMAPEGTEVIVPGGCGGHCPWQGEGHGPWGSVWEVVSHTGSALRTPWLYRVVSVLFWCGLYFTTF